ncbi:MAG: hypothetical protein QF819_07865 [Gemmatimonadota bacterium]|jgi:hypothetical protein|nr:hypothetical protein [Gemmatimonadota bacterium]MDP6462141.1 hypothetical protein [Gemmatimonadota bacterium]MDP6528508.1 hypothetical protein [Gemmatimonadota bacterium]MDP6803075.1 hypothetical protein [Gemmatimonadota bacterium]
MTTLVQETAERVTRIKDCPTCDGRKKMRVLRALDDTGVEWLNCLTCNSIVCFEGDEETGSLRNPTAVGLLGDAAPGDFRTYVPEECYEIGEFFYHQTWRDVGRVIRKQVLPGSRSAIEVAFLNGGLKFLIEGCTPVEL